MTLRSSVKFLAVAIALTWTSLANAQVLYREIFSNTTGATANLTLSGWQAYIGSNATLAGLAGQTPGVFLDNRSGNPTNLNNTANNAPIAGNTTFGFVTSNVGSASDRNIFLAFTEEFSLNLTNQTAASVSWYQGTPTGIQQRAVIRIGSSWYANDTGFTGLNNVSSGNNMSQSNQQTLDLFGATWRSLTVNPGSNLVLGSVTTIPDLATSTITAFGVLTNNITVVSTNARFDTFEIAAIPEPTSWALVSAGLLSVLIAARRRRS